MFEWLRRAQLPNVGTVIKLKEMDGQRHMTGAVDVGIAIITIVVLFDRATRAVVRCGDNRR